MFRKLFGARKTPEEVVDLGEEPARVVVQNIPVTDDLRKRTQDRLKPKGGFDPYNSGTFKKENAWEKVTRK